MIKDRQKHLDLTQVYSFILLLPNVLLCICVLQPVMNHNPWMLLYFISFLLIVAFFVLNMFVGVVVENFHKCRRHQEAEEAKRREEKRLKRMEKKRRSKEKELAGR